MAKKMTKTQAVKMQKQLVTITQRMLSDKMLHPDSKVGHTKLKFMRNK